MIWADNKKILIAPSILAGDFGFLGRDAERAEQAHADLLHVDVMDGHFVPNLTIGPDAVKGIHNSTKLTLDVHLMITDPLFYLDSFVKAGADIITFHQEAVNNHRQMIEAIHAKGIRCGMALRPKTGLEIAAQVMDQLDLLLIMTVEPGFGGQSFMVDMLSKIKEARAIIKNRNLKTMLEVDGGINSTNVSSLIEAGANIIVAGSAVYGKSDITQAIKNLRPKASLD